VEQHRRQKAKQFFDELRCLVPAARDPKHDRNKVLQLTIERVLVLRNIRAGTAPDDLIFSLDLDAEELPPRDVQDVKTTNRDAESDTAKRLSHNAVEQKRRQQASFFFEELRTLLPVQTGKIDKNTVLHYTIQSLKEMTGVSEDSLAKMVSELSDAENDGTSVVDASVLVQLTGWKLSDTENDGTDIVDAASVLAQLTGWKPSTLSESPTDVVSFAARIAWSPAQITQEQQQLRKRTPIKTEWVPVSSGADCREVDAVGQDTANSDDCQESNHQRKKLRTVSPNDVATCPLSKSTVETMQGRAIKDFLTHAQEEEAPRAFEEELDGLDAPSLLSNCAVMAQVRTRPHPATPLQGPDIKREMSWGENSIMSALAPMLLVRNQQVTSRK